ncbi:MAG: hypothetical protein IH614_12295 [Desulfuromonadales bacterium]|nr:hypothetical protein [Desulfuromonadales bacterium]
MRKESMVHQGWCQVGDQIYEICVYCCRGRHFAQTEFTPEDVIISDGSSLDEVLNRHQQLLPLAVNSRQLLRDARRKPDR